MNIAILNIYNGQIERGLEIFVDNVSWELSQNHKVTIFQGGKKKPSATKNSQNNLSYQIIASRYVDSSSTIIAKILRLCYLDLSSINILFFSLRCLPSLLKKNYDWIIPTNGGWQVVIIRIFRLFKKYRMLISGHAGVGFDDFVNIVFGKPDVFVALTPAALRWAKKITGQKIVEIPNGVDLVNFNPHITPQKVPLSSPIIFCNSALLPYKRVETLIDALKVAGVGSLLLIGDGPYRGRLVQKAQSLLPENRFHHILSVPHDIIAGYYTASKVFTLPSEPSEAFGLVYLEAMACNIPVVAPDDENRRAIIEDAGLFVKDVCNPKEYAEIILQALKTDFADKPRKRAKSFSWYNVSQKYLEALSL